MSVGSSVSSTNSLAVQKRAIADAEKAKALFAVKVAALLKQQAELKVDGSGWLFFAIPFHSLL